MRQFYGLRIENQGCVTQTSYNIGCFARPKPTLLIQMGVFGQIEAAGKLKKLDPKGLMIARFSSSS